MGLGQRDKNKENSHEISGQKEALNCESKNDKFQRSNVKPARLA